MTLSNGNLLAKVTKKDDGSLELVTEGQHLFEVMFCENRWAVVKGAAETFVPATLRVVE